MDRELLMPLLFDFLPLGSSSFTRRNAQIKIEGKHQYLISGLRDYRSKLVIFVPFQLSHCGTGLPTERCHEAFELQCVSLVLSCFILYPPGYPADQRLMCREASYSPSLPSLKKREYYTYTSPLATDTFDHASPGMLVQREGGECVQSQVPSASYMGE